MQRYETEAVALLDIFYKTSGIGAVGLSAKNEIVACVPMNCTHFDSAFFSMEQITDFLKEIYAEASEKETRRQYYTLISEFNFFSNVVPVYRGDEVLGALLTEPVLVKKPDRAEMQKLIDHAAPLPGARARLEKILLETPVVPYERLMPLGRTLYSLVRASFPDEIPRQILRRGRTAPGFRAGAKQGSREKPGKLPAVAKHSPYSTFLTVRGAIQAGDPAALLQAMNGINAGDIPMDQLDQADFIRSVKDSFIKSCALGCYAAIGGNAPYERVMDLSDGFVRRVETLNNVYDIYELMKHAMVSFARAVSIGGALYTKPVSRVMEYIEKHSAQRITLQDLAGHTGLSTFYLSSLIRKETGRSLPENVNKARVEKSKQLLRDRDISMLEVAQLTGFQHQNHFTTVFKRFTGTTPSEFRKNLGLFPAASAGARKPDALLPAVYGEVTHMLNVFPGIADIARVVDPLSHQCWLIDGADSPALSDTCYRFWKRGESCDNCISRRAYVFDETFFKIESVENSVFLVLALPRYADGATLIVELLKKLPGERPLHRDWLAAGDILSQASAALDNGMSSGAVHMSRSQLEEMLPVEVRRSRLEGVPLSVVMLYMGKAMPAPSDTKTVASDMEKLQSAFDEISMGTPFMAAHFTDGYYSLVLFKTAGKEAARIAGMVKENIEKSVPVSRHIHVSFGIATLSDAAPDAESLVRLALQNLRMFQK